MDHKTIVIIGQSNAANYGEKRNNSISNVYVLFNEIISVAKDPILGASGDGGSCWIPVAEQIIKHSNVESILISNMAEGSSTVFDWTGEGRFSRKLHKIFDSLRKVKIEPDFVIWQQGEQDNLLKTSKEKYKSNLEEVAKTIKCYFSNTKIFISLTSFHPNTEPKININIRESQLEIISESDYIFKGPDTDAIISTEDRYDLIHFSAIGSQKLSNKWSEKLIPLLEKDSL